MQMKVSLAPPPSKDPYLKEMGREQEADLFDAK